MIEPNKHNNVVVGLPPMPGILVHCADVQCPAHRTPLRLTISVEKIDRFLADIRKQVEALQRQMTNLRLVRTQVASYQQKNLGQEGQAPYSHRPLVGIQSDS